MNKTILKVATFFAVALALGSCSNGKFHINGNITEANDSTLYFEHMSLDGPVIIDSVKLDETGEFEFSGSKPEAPEFYRLRIARQIISLSVDSTETINIKAAYPSMASQYTVEGSDNCEKIKELSLKQMDLQANIMAIQSNYNLSNSVMRDSILNVIEAYKKDVKVNYIFKEPMKAYSYFALFQAIGSSLIFNPRENKDDIKAYAAVATSWDTYYPEALRGKNLHNIALEGMKDMRIIENKRNAQIDPEKVTVSTIIDISLIDNKGNTRTLTSLAGKVVLLDFHVFAAKESTARIMQLRELYNKYHSRGLEIYQVSLDTDEHFWKQQTAALPWISVRDPKSFDSETILRYNVQEIPTFFLIDKSNSLYKRDAQIKNIDSEIQSLL